MTDLTALSATDLTALIATRGASAVEVMTAHLDRIDRVNPAVNAELEAAAPWAARRAPLHV